VEPLGVSWTNAIDDDNSHEKVAIGEEPRDAAALPNYKILGPSTPNLHPYTVPNAHDKYTPEFCIHPYTFLEYTTKHNFESKLFCFTLISKVATVCLKIAELAFLASNLGIFLLATATLTLVSSTTENNKLSPPVPCSSYYHPAAFTSKRRRGDSLHLQTTPGAPQAHNPLCPKFVGKMVINKAR